MADEQKRYRPGTPEYEAWFSQLYEEKYGYPPPPGYFGKSDISSATFGKGWEEMAAPSTNKGEAKPAGGRRAFRPRALKIGYHQDAKLLVIVFRPPTKVDRKNDVERQSGKAPWVVYEEVDAEMWEELKNYHSTGEWLRFSGVESNKYYRVPGDDKAGLTKIVDTLLAK